MHRHSTAEVLGVVPSVHASNGNNAVISNHHSAKNCLDSLPKQFLVSMKKLFDILDDQRTGYVKFSDIQKGWQDDGCKGLPQGVIESLRKVTPANGLLSFDRFCTGLRICLLRNQSEITVKPSTLLGKQTRPPSAPLLDIENPVPNAQWTSAITNNMATVRPHNIVPTQRTLSLPQLSPDSEMEIDLTYNSPPAPPKPPRSSVSATSGIGCPLSGGILTTAPIQSREEMCAPNIVSASAAMAALDKAEIRHALQNWQMGILMNEMDSKDKRKHMNYASNQIIRGTADGGSSSATDGGLQSITQKSISVVGYQKKSSSKRREPRRHTLQNGIDYNLLKRLKQFEEERDLLLQGMSAVEKAREWYIQQIANVQEKIKYLGRMGSHVDQWSEVQQERLDFQRARVLEVNRHLSTLSETWERGGFPLHINLAIRSSKHNSNGGFPQPVDRLKQQNRHLTNEVNIKSDKIALLEREKQALIQELFELQQRINTGFVGSGNSVRGGLISVSQSSPVCSSSSGGLGDADVVY